LNSEHYRQVVNDYVRCMSAGDWRGVVALYADNATVEDPVGSEAIRGIEAIAAFYQGTTASGVRLELAGPVRVAGGEAAFPFSAHLVWEGKPVRIDAIDVFKFDHQGKIASMRAYFGPENFVPAS